MNRVQEHLKKEAANRKILPLNGLTWVQRTSQNMHKRALFEGWDNLIFPAQTFTWASRNGGKSLLIQQKELAEREGFEPPLPFRVNLISSQAPSTGLGHLSPEFQLLSRLISGSQFLCSNVVTIPCETAGENLKDLLIWRIYIALMH